LPSVLVGKKKKKNNEQKGGSFSKEETIAKQGEKKGPLPTKSVGKESPEKIFGEILGQRKKTTFLRTRDGAREKLYPFQGRDIKGGESPRV